MLAFSLLCAVAASDLEAYMDRVYAQPQWSRRDDENGKIHSTLEKAAVLHQDGELEKAVQLYKQVIKMDPQHGEAYATLSKVLADQGKIDLSDKAMLKATKIHNDQLASWSLF